MQSFKSFTENLSKKLESSSLPGLQAQLTMAPATRKEEIARLGSNVTPRQSAVLVLFYPVQNEPYVVFIKRPVDESVHSGQIAFPGGRVEPEDKNFIETALREANEEVNIEPGNVKIFGSLSKLHIPPSNFDVYPVIGYSNSRPDFKGDIKEVDKILEISVKQLIDPKTKTVKTIHHRMGKLVDVPCYFIQGEIIWGATAMMLGELLELIDS